MDILRVSVVAPPEANRSRWVREQLAQALAGELKPELFPAAEAVSFTVSVPPLMATALKVLAQTYDWTVGELVGGLIEAQRQQDAASKAAKPDKPGPHEKAVAPVAGIEGMPGSDRVRPLLYPLLRDGNAGVLNGKLVFAEAATGTGKGSMIASMAATAASRGDTVLISAPLAVTWQLIEGLAKIKEVSRYGVGLILGRPNFVSHDRLHEWATEHDCQDVLEWLEKGAPALTERLVQSARSLRHGLSYMLEDALSLAPNLPVDYCMLDAEDDPEDCPAAAAYHKQRQHESDAAIVVCSHYMLAASCRTQRLQGDRGLGDTYMGGSLPGYIDTLIVDEAHLLEGAFAAVNGHTLRLRPLIRSIETDVSRGRNAAVSALKALYDLLRQDALVAAGKTGCSLDDLPGVKPSLEATLDALEGIKTNSLPNNTRMKLRIAIRAIKDALSGYSRVRVDLSPVKKHPMLLTGRANLSKAFSVLWDNCAGAFLTSATLFTDGANGNLIRWKLEAPKERALYLPPIHPVWVTEPVTYMKDTRVATLPDDSPQWADEAAAKVLTIAEGAAGGVLVLCTSLQNAEQLAERLKGPLNNRLIVQSGQQSASMCAALFRALPGIGHRPVWLGVGSAWTGIDLSDYKAEPAQDRLLTDLVITRLPVGLNRTITHDRRVQIAGFRIIAQEALWMFRQGLGRLVRREGVQKRQLWVLDGRIDGSEPWVKPFTRLLGKYRANKATEATNTKA